MAVTDDYSEFWERVRERFNSKNLPLRFAKSNKSPFIIAASGIEGISYGLAIEYNFPEVILIFDNEREINDYYFDFLEKQKIDIELDFGTTLNWQRSTPRKNRYQISLKEIKYSYRDKAQWEAIIKFMMQNVEMLHNVMQVRLDILKEKYDHQEEIHRSTYKVFMRKLQLNNFATFENLEISTSSSINVFFGSNDTGKTLLLKLLYSVVKSWEVFSRKEYYEKANFSKILADKLYSVYQPRENRRIGELVTKGQEKLACKIVFENNLQSSKYQHIDFQFTDSAYRTVNECVSEIMPIGMHCNALYIPPNEVLTALKTTKYAREKLFLPGFDDTVLDLINSLEIPASSNPRPRILEHIAGRFEAFYRGTLHFSAGEEPVFFQRNNQKYGISLVSNSIKKMGVIPVLMRNGQIGDGSILFIDEPESDLDAESLNLFTDVVFELSQAGVQVFIASHDYYFVKTLANKATESDSPLNCHSFTRNKNKVTVHTSDLRHGMPDHPLLTIVEKQL